MTELSVRPCSWDACEKELSAIRKTVFVEEQKVPEELEWDGEDQHASHVIAYWEGLPVGTARLLPSGQIGRMSVLQAYRRRGVGTALLEAAEQLARTQNLPGVFLHAQSYIAHFYQQQGYAPQGNEFMDAGIPHIEMTKSFS